MLENIHFEFDLIAPAELDALVVLVNAFYEVLKQDLEIEVIFETRQV